jgi:predicted RND superfamily exporter protein
MEELFNKYTEAFDAFDPEAIANLYRLPCAISDADGVQAFASKSDLVKKFASNCESMRDFGYQHAQFNILQQQPLGQDKVATTIGWRINTRSSSIDFRTLYICHLVDSKWFVFSANVYQGSFSNVT